MLGRDYMKSLKEMFSSKNKAKKLGTVRTDFYRGYFIKRNSDDSNKWSVVLGSNAGVGEISHVKMSIDHWIEYGIYASPDHFKTKATNTKERQVTSYKGFKIVNDLGGKNDWYITYRGQLMKGSKEKIIAVIDRVEQKRAESKKQTV